MSISRRNALVGATAAVVVAGVPAGVQADEPPLDEEANAKKRAVLLKELRTLALSIENRVNTLQERLARALEVRS